MNLFPSFVIDRRRFYTKNSTHLFVIYPREGKKFRVNRSKIQLLLLGLCLGVTLGVLLVPTFDLECGNPTLNSYFENSDLSFRNRAFPEKNPNPNFDQKESIVNEINKKSRMRRPRFYSTELGLRKKIIVGIILTTANQAGVDRIIALNRTLSPVLTDVVFFVEGQSAAIKLTDHGVTGVVTLREDSNSKGFKPFKKNDGLNRELEGGFNAHANGVGNSYLDRYYKIWLKGLKYFGTKVVDDFDYFFIAPDNFYVDGKELRDSVKNISISDDLFWGVDSKGSGFCDSEKGIVLGRSVVKKLSARLDRCIQNRLMRINSNLTKCFQYALGSSKCRGTVQGQIYFSVSLDNWKPISKAVSIGPLHEAEEFYMIHETISKARLNSIFHRNDRWASIIRNMAPLIPKGFDITTWPLGMSPPHRPTSRFDVIKWQYFTIQTIYPKNENHVAVQANGIDTVDIKSVVNLTANYLHETVGAKGMTFQYGYRRLDHTRGMEYLLDFFDENREIYRVECLRPLNRIEILPMPFVTENRRLTIVIPIKLEQDEEVRIFINDYIQSYFEKKFNSVLIFAIVVKSTNEISNDQLIRMKRMISQANSYLSTMSKNGTGGVTGLVDSIKVGYVVINRKLFKGYSYVVAVFDTLSSRVLSPNSLIFTFDSFITLNIELLNRIKMNTILNYQVFSPIPFVEYNPKISHHSFERKDIDIHKGSGYFDSESYGAFSFFIADYLAVRKLANVSSLLKTTEHDGINLLPQLFLRGSNLHVLRAPEPNLKVRFDINSIKRCSSYDVCSKMQWGSKMDLAKLILDEL